MESAPKLDIKRIQALTDAIFAVAMTILILEIKIPNDLNQASLRSYFSSTTLPDFLVYFISYIVLGLFWVSSHFHHHLIIGTNRISSWLNILFLMMICVIPFSAKFLIHYREDRLAIIFYSCNLISANFCHMFMLMYAWKKNFIRPHLTVSRYKKALKRIILIILIYLSVIPVSFLSVEISIYLFLIPIIINFLPESCDLNDYKISKNKNRFF
jgi:uncharacterized membrane protein